MNIHPTAIISPNSNLPDDIDIGPYAIIGNGVTLGPGCRVQAHAVLEKDVIMGAKNVIGYGAVIGAAPQDFSHNDSIRSEVRIGDENTFREYVTIHRGAKEGSATVVGDKCYLMAGSHLGHNVKLGNRVVIANNCLLAGYVEVGDGAVLGGGTVFHQLIRIGRLAMVRGGTRFGKDIPPYAMADRDNLLSGVNAVGMRRSGISSEARIEIKRAFRLIFQSGLNVSQALAEASEASWSADAQVLLDFARTSKRGMSKGKKSADLEEQVEG